MHISTAKEILGTTENLGWWWSQHVDPAAAEVSQDTEAMAMGAWAMSEDTWLAEIADRNTAVLFEDAEDVASMSKTDVLQALELAAEVYLEWQGKSESL